MSSRIDAPETDADIAIRDVLDRQSLPGFTVIAGAGSGKTTSLVKALAHVTRARGSSLRANGQQVACITYTEVAAKEIFEEIGEDPLAWVSTIHSFLWEVIKPFQRDIGKWVQRHLNRKIEAVVTKQAAYASGTRQNTKLKDDAELDRRRGQLTAAAAQQRWTYGVGNDYARGVLGHAEVISMVPELICESDLLARIVGRRFPFIFVDESQDAFPTVVDCLKRVWSIGDGKMCLGFFGDPMQQIYMGGIKDVEPLEGWERIEKPENFRSSSRVLACVNAVRSGDDSLFQVTGLPDQPDGEAFCFVLPVEARDQSLNRVTSWLDVYSVTGPWSGDPRDGGAKVLLIEHRMAADRLGFSALHEAFREGGAGLTQSFEEGAAWPLKPFRDVIGPLCSAPEVRSPALVRVLAQSPLFGHLEVPGDMRGALDASRKAVVQLREMAADAGRVTLGEMLSFAIDQRLVEPDPRLAAFLHPNGPRRDVVLDDRTSKVLEAMSACTYAELAGYEHYVERHSPYATHQGTKGTEFDRVVVVLDDDASRHRQFSYEKLLGLEALSKTDEQNQAAGHDSVVERTRRLLYVCVSRARTSVAIILIARDVDAAVAAVKGSDLSDHVHLLTGAELAADA